MGDLRMSPLSPSKPPITPLKRAAHRGLTPPRRNRLPPEKSGLMKLGEKNP
jgi:hypothetical protein